MVILTIPASKEVITEFNKERYIRIGSSKELLKRFPEREKKLWQILSKDEWNIVEAESRNQELSFNILKANLISRGFHINEESFCKNYKLKTKNGKFNVMADLLSDVNDASIQIVKFRGEDKSEILDRTEFGGISLISMVNRVLDKLEALNFTKMVIGVPYRRDIKLYDMESVREAFINSVVHNSWNNYNSPIIYFFSNRIEIVTPLWLGQRSNKRKFL